MADEKPNYITVQLIAPCTSYPYGKIEEGFWLYCADSNIVSLVTAKGAKRYDRNGKSIQCAVAPGETARKVAWQLTKDNAPNRNSGFNRKLHYPNLGKI